MKFKKKKRTFYILLKKNKFQKKEGKKKITISLFLICHFLLRIKLLRTSAFTRNSFFPEEIIKRIVCINYRLRL